MHLDSSNPFLSLAHNAVKATWVANVNQLTDEDREDIESDVVLALCQCKTDALETVAKRAAINSAVKLLYQQGFKVKRHRKKDGSITYLIKWARARRVEDDQWVLDATPDQRAGPLDKAIIEEENARARQYVEGNDDEQVRYGFKTREDGSQWEIVNQSGEVVYRGTQNQCRTEYERLNECDTLTLRSTITTPQEKNCQRRTVTGEDNELGHPGAGR